MFLFIYFIVRVKILFFNNDLRRVDHLYFNCSDELKRSTNAHNVYTKNNRHHVSDTSHWFTSGAVRLRPCI